MYRYNEVYKKLGNLWFKSNDNKKEELIEGMFRFLSKEEKEQEKEYAILDFMDRYVYGTNTSTDTLASLKLDRGFNNYKK